jgi:hypothetical protein
MDNTLLELKAKVACLESQTDMLESELSYLNEMLMRCGFPMGIATLKETVQELLAEDVSEISVKRPECI